MKAFLGLLAAQRREILVTILILLTFVAVGMRLRNVDTTVDPDARHEFLLWRSALELRAGQYNEAISYLRAAIDEAFSTAHRAEAALRMGQVLLNRSRIQKGDYAFMAQQYFLAVMDALAKDDPLYLEAARMLFNATILSGDQMLFERVARLLVDLTSDPKEKEALYLRWIGNRMQVSSYRETAELMQEAITRMPEQADSRGFGFMRADVARKTLENPVWFQEYGALHPELPTNALRAAISADAMQWLEQKIRVDPQLRSECYFWMARLQESSGNRDDARKYIRLYLKTEPETHFRDALLMTVRLFCQDGDPEAADERMRVFTARYGLDDESEAQLLKLAELFEAQGKLAQAYETLGEAFRFPFEHRAGSAVLNKASRIACRLGRYEEAWGHYKILTSVYIVPALNKDLLLAQADTCLSRNDFTEAEKWVATYLYYFPVDTARAEGLYRLFKIKQMEGAQQAELVTIGLSAMQADVTHPLIMPTLMETAQIMEDLGLYSTAALYYNRLALLGFVGSTNTPTTFLRMDSIHPAILGKARCFLKAGEVIKADRLLREICRNRGETSSLQSEAAYWWATIAVENGQGREALRRLDLIESGSLTSNLAVRAEIERQIAVVLTGADWKKVLPAIFRRASDLAPAEQTECLQRACRLLGNCFEQKGEDAAVHLLLNLAANSVLAKTPFFNELFFRFAAVTIRERGVPALVGLMQPDGAGISNVIQSVGFDEPVLFKLYRQFVEVRQEAAQ